MRRHSGVGKTQDNDLEKSENKEKLETSKKKWFRRRHNYFKEYLIDFTANSNLHGLKYIGEKERTFVEKVFWLFVFSCCVILCAGLIRKVWLKWNESPVIVSFAENPTPVWQIPYPAVTVCFETKAMQTRFNFTKYYHLYNNSGASLEEWERNLFEDISLVCDDHLAPTVGRKTSNGTETVNNIKRLSNVMKRDLTSNKTSVAFRALWMQSLMLIGVETQFMSGRQPYIIVSPNETDVIFGCKWKDDPKDTCGDLFSPILTEEGQCYTFNTLGADQLFRLENLHTEYKYLEYYSKANQSWTLEEGYPAGSPLETYPHRGLGYGVKAGLTFLLQGKEIDLDYLCKGPVQGFKILLHNPAELPRLSQQYFRAPLSQEVVVAVKPKMMTTSDGLKPYDPKRRLCYFPTERYLQYFKVYTQANCEMECLTNFTLARCGCVQFGMPHGPNMPVCNAGSVPCIKNARLELTTFEVQLGLEEPGDPDDTLGSALEVATQCSCLPACTSIEYEAETSQADYDANALFRAFNYPIDEAMEDLRFARVMVFFKEAQFITSRRSELYGQTDFLANCGGLLGLFMGFSILSVVEILYFLSLRLICLFWSKRSAKKRIAAVPDEKGDVLKTDHTKQFVD